MCGRRTTGTIAISLCGLVPAESDLTVVELLSATRAETSGPARCVTELLASYRQHGYVPVVLRPQCTQCSPARR